MVGGFVGVVFIFVMQRIVLVDDALMSPEEPHQIERSEHGGLGGTPIRIAAHAGLGYNL